MIVGKCPRCGGFLTTDTDKFGTYDSCIQCGWLREHTTGQPLDGVSAGKGGPPKVSRRVISAGGVRL